MAQRSIRTFKDRIKWLATIQGGEWLKEMRGNLAMVASVIATMTFQIGLNPPGGVVQNGDKGFIKCPTHKGNDQACPGQSVFAFADKDKYYAFLWTNNISFFTSVLSCIWLISGIPLDSGVPTFLLSVLMCLSFCLLAISYTIGASIVNPHQDIFRHGDGAFVGFIALFVVLGFLFILRLVALCFEIIDDREGTPTPSTAAAPAAAPTTDESRARSASPASSSV